MYFQVCLLIPTVAVLSTVYLVIGPFFVDPIPCLAWILITLLGKSKFNSLQADDLASDRDFILPVEERAWPSRNIGFIHYKVAVTNSNTVCPNLNSSLYC